MATDSQGRFIDEDHFDLVTGNGSQQDRNISQMQYSTNINSLNVYAFMDFTYHGNGGYRDGSFLIPFSRESSFFDRRRLAHFKNYLKPIVRAMIDPVFTEYADRTVVDDAGNPITESMFTDFLDDCDSAETFIQDYTKQAVTLARRHGVSFTVMDNYPSTAQPATVSQALQDRIFPYVYAKRAYEVEDYEVDQFGNLIEITFAEEPVKINNELQKRWRRWTTTESVVLTKAKNNAKEWITVSSATHNLGVVPVIMTFSEARECNSKILVDPPLYDIAKLNFVIFNQSAEIRDQERAQAFSIFYCQGVPPQDLVISNNTYINIPSEATISPGYASPDFGIIAGLVANQEQMRKDLFAIAEQSGVVGVQSQTSGVAMAYDFYAHESTLKQTASMATTLEQKIAQLFQRYTSESFVYTVSYPSDYAPMGQDNEVSRLDKVLRIPGLNKTFANKVQQKLARMVLSDEDDDVINEVTAAIEAESKTVPEPTGEVEPPAASTEEPDTDTGSMGATGMVSE